MSPETVVLAAFGVVAVVGGTLLNRRERSSIDFLREGTPPSADDQAMPFRAAVRIGFVRSQYSRCTISPERITMRVSITGRAREYVVERADVERAVAVRGVAGRGIRFVEGGKVHDAVTLWVAGGTEWDDRLRDLGWA